MASYALPLLNIGYSIRKRTTKLLITVVAYYIINKAVGNILNKAPKASRLKKLVPKKKIIIIPSLLLNNLEPPPKNLPPT